MKQAKNALAFAVRGLDPRISNNKRLKVFRLIYALTFQRTTEVDIDK